MANTSSPQQSRQFLYLHKQDRKHDAYALLAFALLLTILRWRAIKNINTDFLGGYEGDVGLYIWILRSNIADIFSRMWFETRAFYPYSLSLAYTDNFILPSLLGYVLTALGASLALTFNLLVLGANLLNGFVTYKLCAKISGSARAAFVAGLAFMFYPFLAAHYGHTQLQFAFFLPLSIIFLLHYVAKPSFLTALLTGLTLFTCFITTVYYSLFVALIIPVLLLAFVVLQRDYFDLKTISTFVLGSALGALPTVFFLWPYLEVKKTFGSRGIFEAFYLAASGISYFTAPYSSFLYGGITQQVKHLFLGIHSEAELFPGFMILGFAAWATIKLFDGKTLRRSGYITAGILLAGFLFSFLYFPKFFNLPLGFNRHVAAILLWLGIIASIRHLYLLGALERKLGFAIITNRGLIAAFAFLAVVFFAVSVGPLGNPDHPETPTAALGFFRVLYEIFPGYDSMRAIGRAGIVTVLSLIVLASIGLTKFLERQAGSVAVFLLLIVGIIHETAVTGFPVQYPTGAPIILNKLAEHAKPGDVAIFLPFAGKLQKRKGKEIEGAVEFAKHQVNYMNWGFDLDLKLVNGYSGQETKITKEFPEQLAEFPDARSIKNLSSIVGLKYLVYFPKLDPNYDAKTFSDRVKPFSNLLTYIDSDDRGNMLFEFGGVREVLAEDFFRLPARPQGIFSFELMTPQSKLASVSIKVSRQLKEKGSQEGLGQLELKPDGLWQHFDISIPSSDSLARPNWLSLKTEPESKLFIRNYTFKRLE